MPKHLSSGPKKSKRLGKVMVLTVKILKIQQKFQLKNC